MPPQRKRLVLYVANTLGAVAGALGAGFVFIPAFGLQGTFVYTSRLLVVSGVAIAVAAAAQQVRRGPSRSAVAAAFAGAVITVFTFVIPEWDRDLHDERRVQIFALDTRGGSGVEPSCRTSRVLQRRSRRNRQRTAACRNALACDRRQSRRIERWRHAHATTARAASHLAAPAAARAPS